jgi:hypothetical protein
VREPPPDVDVDVLQAVVRHEWDSRIERLAHLPLGFGAHHWAAYAAGSPSLFVTLDRRTATRSVQLFEAAYLGAIALRQTGLEFVLAPLPSTSGSPVVSCFGGVVSCTQWQAGESGGDLDAVWTSRGIAQFAPRERDLRDLVETAVAVDPDADMVEMFDLEWRLDEISQYADWFAAEHHGTDDDRIAFDALIEELTRR